MADTLEIALKSVLDQIDERFEVILVDDGSRDDSVKIAQRMEIKYSNLKLISLVRDANRKLGETRNISIRAAKGMYVLLHIDCDDITAPFICDFVEVFHQIEQAHKRDILLSGRPIQMGKKAFLLRIGPYRNIHRGEDRDLWNRSLKIGAYIPLFHKSFKTRLPKSKSEQLRRDIYYTFDHLRNDFRRGLGLGGFILSELKYHKQFSMKMSILRFAICPIAWLQAKREGVIDMSSADSSKPLSAEESVDYINNNGGTYAEILGRFGVTPNWEAISDEGKNMFAEGD